jgi:ribosome-associated protein
MHDEYEQYEYDQIEPEKSKSQIKREFAALQELSGQIIALKPAQVSRFDFSQIILDALEEHTRIKNRTAQQRHIRRIAKLLSDEDVDAIRHTLERLDANHPENRRRLELLEQWRERLISEGDTALNQLADICPGLDRQRLRQLIRSAQKEVAVGKAPAAAKKIFAYIKTLEF